MERTVVVVVSAGLGATVVVVSRVVVVVAVVGSLTTVVQELRIAATAGTMQMIVSFFISGCDLLMVESLSFLRRIKPAFIQSESAVFVGRNPPPKAR